MVATTAQWDPDAGAIYTFITIDVARAWGLDGPPPEVVLKQLGGVVGATALAIGGQAHFAVGETVFVFLDVRPRDLTLLVAGLEQGKWTLSDTPARLAGPPRWQRHLDAPGAIGDSRAAADLEALARLAGTRVHAAGAQMVPPMAQPEASAIDVSAAVPAAGPIPARWHEADSDTPVYVDSQAGGHPQFAGGGLAQLSNAAALWNAAGSLRCCAHRDAAKCKF